MSQGRRQPLQKRSRERVEHILAAAAELIDASGVEGLSSRAVAERASVPIGSVYRYFGSVEEIIIAFLDREMELIDTAVIEAVLQLERVSLDTLCEAAVRAHFDHHRQHPRAVTLWFDGRQNRVVREHVEQQDKRLADWLLTATRAAGLLKADAPDYGAQLVVRLADRMFEFVFLADRSAEQQRAIVDIFVGMISTELRRYATPAGIEGISAEEFLTVLGAAND